MWKTKRQTKKHRTKNKPKHAAQLLYYTVGVISFIFVIVTIISSLDSQKLIIPVIYTNSRGGFESAIVSGGTDEIERAFREKNISFLFVTRASDSAIVVTMPGNAEVLMKSEGIPEQIASLQLIIHRLTMEGKRFSRLDLRFDRPVVVLAK
ncbi:MAG: hypothetical protein Q8Q49_05350 [bacterium]|nr:hypothetical protein [bacterium]